MAQVSDLAVGTVDISVCSIMPCSHLGKTELSCPEPLRCVCPMVELLL